jgi:hypothetical protein
MHLFTFVCACGRVRCSRLRSTREYESVDDIDFMADLQRVEEERLALVEENARLTAQQVCVLCVCVHVCVQMCTCVCTGGWWWWL